MKRGTSFMNRRIRVMTLLIVCLLPILLISGCKKEKALPKKSQELLWRAERTKPFGVFEYSDLSKEEAETILKEKFSVSLSTLTKKTEAILDEELLTDTGAKGTVTYTIDAKENKLQVRGFYPYEQGDTMQAFAYIDSEYHYLPEKKQANLIDQTITLSNYGESSAFQSENVEPLLKKLGELVQVENLTIALTQLKESEKEVKSKELEVSDNGEDAYKKKNIRSSLYVGIDEKSEIKEIYARLTDYRE